MAPTVPTAAGYQTVVRSGRSGPRARARERTPTGNDLAGAAECSAGNGCAVRGGAVRGGAVRGGAAESAGGTAAERHAETTIVAVAASAAASRRTRMIRR